MKYQAKKVWKFTCLKCLSDLNLGHGNSSNFASSHRKSWPCSLSGWCCCDLGAPPSAPSQQLISSSCSFGNRRNSDDQMFSNKGSLQMWGDSTGNSYEGLTLYHTPYTVCDVTCFYSASISKNKMSSVQSHLLSLINFNPNMKRLALTRASM